MQIGICRLGYKNVLIDIKSFASENFNFLAEVYQGFKIIIIIAIITHRHITHMMSCNKPFLITNYTRIVPLPI